MSKRPESAVEFDTTKYSISGDRRRVLRAAAGTVAIGSLGLLAGCAGLTNGSGEPTVRVINEDEISHLVGVTVTDDTGDIVEEASPEEIQPGVSREFTSDGYADGEYQVEVAGDTEPAFKQTTRWTDLDRCPSLVFEVRITRVDGRQTIAGFDECESE